MKNKWNQYKINECLITVNEIIRNQWKSMRSMKTDDNLWKSIKIQSKNKWTSIRTIKDQLKSMKIIENQWKHISGVGGMGGALEILLALSIYVVLSTSLYKRRGHEAHAGRPHADRHCPWFCRGRFARNAVWFRTHTKPSLLIQNQYIYIYIYVYTYVCMYMYIYVWKPMNIIDNQWISMNINESDWKSLNINEN